MTLTMRPYFFPLTFVFLFIPIIIATSSIHHDYCVIGAGPSGLQIGYFLHQKNRDYIIFERNNVSGSFYVKYPRHRKLISINKRNTGKTNKEFNLRHDWNSLLSHDESLHIRHYSKELFPHADILVKYLKDYTEKLGLKVQYNTNIQNIQRQEDLYTMEDNNGQHYTCSKLIVATGIATPNIPSDFIGNEYVIGYEDVSINPEDFEGQSVLILGRGNAAFETADAIYGNTNVVHMVARSRVRLSWATHYVGDLRAVNNGLLDTYQLKSLDGVLEAGLEEVKIVKKDGKLHLQFKEDEDDPVYNIDNFALRDPYDKIIRCLGFVFDKSIFNNKTMISSGKGRAKKYPKINYDYESSDNPGMFFAGTNTHSLDFRKSAGGFIHGFRYTARALHHLLEWRYHQVPWPSITAPITQIENTIVKRLNEASGMYQMFGVLGDIIVIKDNGLEFDYLEEFPINLIDDLYKHSGHNATRIIAIVMEYGKDFSGPGNDIFRIDRATGEPAEAHQSNFLHPVLYYYDKLPTAEDMQKKPLRDLLPPPKLLHHIVEDFLTSWDGWTSHLLPLRRFLEEVFDQDLRSFFADNCMRLALTHKNVPLSCQADFMEGQGLVPTYSLAQLAKDSKFLL
ncbi:FAD-dependent oxidoreductase domain-containing protein 2-like [Saccostrea cucullata]|uniref:FAD-dependent oxidoreductase domain-containing protein 2-like n=1 Tax=Saccostrea cuccullata TaxID=36930 RepID=UPI002ED4DDB4